MGGYGARNLKKTESSLFRSAAVEIYALSEVSKDARLRLWVSEELGRREVWPAVIQVDNAFVELQVVELRDDSKIVTKKVDTAVNVSDVLTKCLT